MRRYIALAALAAAQNVSVCEVTEAHLDRAAAQILPPHGRRLASDADPCVHTRAYRDDRPPTSPCESLLRIVRGRVVRRDDLAPRAPRRPRVKSFAETLLRAHGRVSGVLIPWTGRGDAAAGARIVRGLGPGQSVDRIAATPRTRPG